MTDTRTPETAPSRATRRWTLVGIDGTADVELTADEDAPLGGLLPELGRLLGAPAPALWAGSSRLSSDHPLDAPELGHGAVLGLGRPVPREAAGQRSSALELHVVGGPDAGRTTPLGQGRHVLGRGSEATVRLEDPDVSRRHAVVQVGGGGITVADLGSTNGSLLAEEPLGPTPRSWPAGAILRLGCSAVTVTGPGGPGVAVEPAPGGRLRVRPAQRLGAPRAEVEVVFPRPPAAPQRRRLAWVAVALPAAGGVLMAWLLHTPTFLFFALLSPVVALGTWLSERWSGRGAGRRDTAAHAVALHEARTRLTDAVRADVRAAEAAAPDLAGLTSAARRRSSLLWSRTRGDADALVVRLGTGPAATAVTRVDPEGGRSRETAPHVPVTLDLRTSGGLGIVGPRERITGVLDAVVAQLTALHAPGELDLVLLTTRGRLPSWRWARWLPHLEAAAVHVAAEGAAGTPEAHEDDEALGARLASLAARRRAASTATGRTGTQAVPGWLVVVVDRPLDARLTTALRAGRDAGILTLAVAESGKDLPVSVEAVLRLCGETGDLAVLSRQGLPDRAGTTVDRLPRPAAARFARDLASLTAATSSRGLPTAVRLVDLPAAGLALDATGGITGQWSRARDRLVAVLGRTADGPLQLDLCRQGPHVLVAGTTGSGKSELLQTLIAGLATAHPPDRCSFLLVDYKGGAAFAEAAALPHTVGLVTDLDGQSTARALRSLGAELTRREGVLAAHAVADIGALPESADLARLVIVVDEFATLAEELPAFVPGLVSIAQRGRSLGVHLVLATQRPGGVVSPEIRANCTLRICLRTTDEADSRDVLGTVDAAHLPVELPGRAYLRSGSGEPTALQVARVATGGTPGEALRVEVRHWTWPLSAPTASDATATATATEDSDLARLSRALGRHAAATGVRAPHRPWQPALPDLVPVESLMPVPDQEADRTRLRIGLVDHPDDQTQQPLDLDLAEGGAWLAVGGPRSGRTTLLRTVLGEAVGRLGPDELQVHVLESGGGTLGAVAAALPHTGTTVGADDVLRTVRLVDRLAQDVADRRGGRGSGHPAVLLLVDGVDALCAVLDEADPGRGSAQFLRLVRDGAAVGLTCVLTADRAVPGGRLAALARQRLVLPLPDRADYAVAGIPARSVPGHRPPGRALVGEEGLECQLALPRPLQPRSAGGRRLPPQLLIAELPADPVLGVQRHETEPGRLLLPVGPGGDSGDPLVVDLLRTGGLLVSGPPGCGRTTALEAFAFHLSAGGAAILRIGRPPPGHGGPSDDASRWLDPLDEAGMTNWLGGLQGRAGVVVADDLGSPPECPALGRLPAPGARGGVVLLAAAPAALLSGHYTGPVAALRRNRSGLLLCPGPGDADLLGIRLPRTPLAVRPGSGWLVTGPRLERVQVARRKAVPPVAAPP